MGDNIRKSPTFYLFSKPSFIEGFGRIFDFAGSLQEYNYSKTEKEADKKAIENDWKTVGIDIRTAVEKYERESAG